MLRISRATKIGFALFCLFLGMTAAVPAASAGERDDIWEAHRPYFCRSDQPMQNRFYFSSVQRSDTTLYRQEVEKSFRAFMAKKYGYPNTEGVSCTARALANPVPMETIRQQVFDNLHAAHYDVAETDWTYAPGTKVPAADAPPYGVTPSTPIAPSPAHPAASPAPAAPAPVAGAARVPQTRNASAAPVAASHGAATPAQNSSSQPGAAAAGAAAPRIHAVCWADSDARVKYYSDVFDGTRGDYAAWMPAFKNFLEQKYRFTGFDRCNKQPTLAEAQKYLQGMLAASRSLKLGDGTSPKIIETGWKYE